VLKENEAGVKTADLARMHGVSEATLFNWKARLRGYGVSEEKRLKRLEDENVKLKEFRAGQLLDAAALHELLAKKWWGPPPSAKGRISSRDGPVGTGGAARSSTPTGG